MIRPILSIIIVNYNTKKLLQACLNSIIKYDKRLDFSGKPLGSDQEEIIPAEIIVVDNGSTDGSAEYLQKLQITNSKIQTNSKFQTSNIKHQASNNKHQTSNFKVVFNNKNLGFGKANNQGMKKAKGEYFLLLNSDTLLTQGAISQTLFWLSSHPEYDLTACRLLNKDKSPQSSVGSFPILSNVFLMLYFDHLFKKQLLMSSPDKAKKADWVMGAFMLFRKEVFVKTKGFDEKIFMYMEEVEWCYRIKKEGFNIGFYPSASIIHLGGSSSKSRTGPIVNIYRGLVYFYRKHYSKISLFILKLMLKVKALSSLFLGMVRGNEYLKKTYRQAFQAIQE